MKDILWLGEISKKDLLAVGGKGANLGELAKIKMPVPNVFCVSVGAYFNYIKRTGLRTKFAKILKNLDPENTKQLNSASEKIKKLILKTPMDSKLVAKIKKAYLELNTKYVAIRSSATAEDLPTASFAGQQASFLNISGENRVINTIQKCWSSLFEPRSIYYRENLHLNHLRVGISVVVHKMVQSTSSGVCFTVDPATNDRTKVAIEAGWGLGEAIVSGAIVPDRYIISKKDLHILQKEIVKQTWMIKKSGIQDKRVPVPKKIQTSPKLSDKQIRKLAEMALKIERHYRFPQDIEWVLDKDKFHIVQARPVTTLKKTFATERTKIMADHHRVLLRGTGASLGASAGPVQILKSPRELGKITKGDILVAEMTNPSYVPGMKKSAGIITDRGGLTSHAAIVSRELSIPCVVGTHEATKKLKNGQVITVDGDKGMIYEGDVVVKGLEKEQYAKIPKTKTKIYVNLAEPELAEVVAKKPVDGVGLLRAEFIIAALGEHPRSLVERKKEKFFVQKLAQGLEKFAKAFSPRPVVFRATDFKSNEYAELKGGKKYETKEENPMMGYRGALRYVAEPEMFKLELAAIKKVRQRYKNLHLMIPFARTVEEMDEILEIIDKEGLRKGAGFKVWLMIEVPSTIFLIDEFLDLGIDGVSIGSNDLTQLILGLDRDNERIAFEFDERNEAVIEAMKKVISACKKKDRTCSICGQAPSFYPDLTKELVAAGITSVSVNPDVIEKVRFIVAEAEKELRK